MTPKQALSNLIAALTGDDVLQAGLFVGTYRQHGVLQDSISVLARLVDERQPVVQEDRTAGQNNL